MKTPTDPHNTLTACQQNIEGLIALLSSSGDENIELTGNQFWGLLKPVNDQLLETLDQLENQGVKHDH